MKKYSFKRAAEICGVSISRIYKICNRVPNISEYDKDLGLRIVTPEGIQFIKSRKGKRGDKFDFF